MMMPLEKPEKKKLPYREPDGGRVARVEPDLADGFHGGHARERDLHLAEEVGRARVALGDVLEKKEVFGLFCFVLASR